MTNSKIELDNSMSAGKEVAIKLTTVPNGPMVGCHYCGHFCVASLPCPMCRRMPVQHARAVGTPMLRKARQSGFPLATKVSSRVANEPKARVQNKKPNKLEQLITE